MGRPLTGLVQYAAGEDAGLLPALDLALEVARGTDLAPVRGDRLARRRVAARPHGGQVGGRPLVGRQDVDQRVLGGQHHVRRAEQRVGTGREDLDAGVGAVDGELDGGAFGPADPVALHRP